MEHKILCICLTLLVLCMGQQSFAEIANGTCGSKLTWILDDDGTLTISGTGNMNSYNLQGASYYTSSSTSNSPWYSYKSQIINVVIENGVTSIGSYAFYKCSKLKTISIANTVTSIGTEAFTAAGLTSIDIPNSVVSIDGYAFYKCSNLTSVALPSSITKISVSMFRECSKLATVQIPSGVTLIDGNAFEDCYSLTDLIIPESVVAIYDYAFMGCSSLRLTMLSKTPAYLNGTPFPYNSNETFSVRVPEGSLNTYQTANIWSQSYYVNRISEYTALKDGEVYSQPKNVEKKDICYTRTFNNTNWQALYVPFAMSYDDWKDNFEVAKINGFLFTDDDNDGVNEKTYLNITKVLEGSLNPNYPYLIKAKATGEQTITVENTTLYAAASNSIDCSSVDKTFTFTGTYEGVSGEVMYNNNYYGMSGGGLKTVSSSSVSLKPYRWYLKVEDRDGNAAKLGVIYIGVGDDDTNAIEALSLDNKPTENIYNLNGQCVGNEESILPAGIYVKNGKKFIVK